MAGVQQGAARALGSGCLKYQSRQETEMSTQAQKAAEFRALHIAGKPLVLFNVWDAGSAKVVSAAGAKALATSSWSVANANGFSDGERTPLATAIDNLQRIAGATELPVTVDLESGYGERAGDVGETVGRAIRAGAAGCNLEDSFPASGKLRVIAEQVERIRSARETAEWAKIPFFLNVRTDVFFQKPPEQHDQAMLAEAIKRAHAYAKAGADGLFAPGLADIDLISHLAQASPIPLNIMVSDATPPLHALAERGVARISYGPRPYIMAMKALEDAARATNVDYT
jgi:2-methylisocitrate lyase-like PEP mutase family enzyme